jgi:hypothetical protein
MEGGAVGHNFERDTPRDHLCLLGKMEPNLAGSIYVRSSIKFLLLVPFGQQIWLPRLIPFSDWLMLKKSLVERNKMEKFYRGP